jgi:predicted DCC family thiol-disulfide oxidoreductase YuxK
MRPDQGVVYFDGLCMACSAEINHYRKLEGAEHFDFVDITANGFEPAAHGLDPHKVHKVMHVRDREGVLHEGVEAFRTIWKELPRYHFLWRLSDSPAVRPVLELGYRAFVVARPYLPRRKALDCSASPYCEVPK